jgi:2'-hydroxyisoflavone reductase
MTSARTPLRRRRFLAGSAALAALALSRGGTSEAGARIPRAQRPLRLLVLGGPRFLGVHTAEYALARGHSLTFFNRGRTNAERLPQVERIIGDRNGALGGLAGREWDAVIDNSGYVPRQVRLAAELLAPRVRRYLFVSSLSVYPDFTVPRDEDSPVGRLDDETVEKVDGATYGPLKALCERAAQAVFGAERSTIIRPGLIVGPEDNTDRFTWWPARAARGGDFIAPGSPADRIQCIDARDLAAFMVRALERDISGTYNVVSPPGRFTMGELVNESVRAARQRARPAEPPMPVWLPADFLAAQGVQPWSDMPVWLPATGDSTAFAATPVQRALAQGLAIRPLADTVRDTLRWHQGRPLAEREKLKAGIDAAREQTVLTAWRRRGAIAQG